MLDDLGVEDLKVVLKGRLGVVQNPQLHLEGDPHREISRKVIEDLRIHPGFGDVADFVLLVHFLHVLIKVLVELPEYREYDAHVGDLLKHTLRHVQVVHHRLELLLNLDQRLLFPLRVLVDFLH